MAIYLRNEQGQFAYLNHPTIKGDKGEKGDRGEQGLPGKNGRDGVTPNLQVGTVTTLESDQQATVTIGGTKENPVLDFGIPRGKDGINGQGGNNFDDSTISTEKTWSSAKIENFVLTNDEVVWTDVSGENINVDCSKEGYLREIEVFGNTIQNEEDLSNIQHLGELYIDNNGRQQYKIEIESTNYNRLYSNAELVDIYNNMGYSNVKAELVDGKFKMINNGMWHSPHKIFKGEPSTEYTFSFKVSGQINIFTNGLTLVKQYSNTMYTYRTDASGEFGFLISIPVNSIVDFRIFKGNIPNLDSLEMKTSKVTLVLPCQLMKVANISDRLYWDSKQDRYVIEKNVDEYIISQYSNIRRWNKTYAIDGTGMNAKVDNGALCISDKIKGNSVNWMYGSGGQGIAVSSSLVIISNGIENDLGRVTEWVDSLLPIKVTHLLETPRLIETNVTEELKLPTFIEKVYVRVTGGIDGTVKAKAPINGGQAILSLSQKNISLERENAEIKAINEAQDAEIELNQRAINFMLFSPTTESLNEDKENVSAMAIYLANQILKGRLDYNLVVSRYVEFKEDIDSILNSESKQEIIQ